MPVGFTRDEAGAVAAALSYVAAPQRWLYFTDDEVEAAVKEIATPDAAERLAADVGDEVRAAREELLRSPGRVWWLVRPLAWRVDQYRPGEARVAVWLVTGPAVGTAKT